MRGIEKIDYPALITRMKIVTEKPAPMQRECKNDEETLEHLICTDKLSSINLICSGRIEPGNQKISPACFINEDSMSLVGLYTRFKRYGLSALYADGECPAIVLQAFDVIQNVVDKRSAPPERKPK